MKYKLFLKTISAFLAFQLCLPLHAFADGVEEPKQASEVIAYEAYNLSDSISFTEQYIIDENSNEQKGFVIEVSSDSAPSSIVFLNGENLNTRTYVTELVSDNAPETGSIAAAMNADFFNMSTGLCESIVIKNGVMLTSDRDNYSFGFDKDGKAFIDKPSVFMPLVTPYGEYTVLHYNKEFTEYGLYLYSEAYGERTRINVPSYELVLVPYSQKLDYEQMSALIYGEEGVPFDLVLKRAVGDNSEELYINERYKEDIDTFAFENGYTLNGLNFYMPAKPEAVLGESISAYVAQIRDNTQGESLEIPKDTFLLCANKETQYHKLEKIQLMDDITVTFNCSERFIGAKEAIGCGALIVDGGEIVEHSEQSHYSAPNPRTAIGIKADGSVVMFAVDGRQNKYSKGMTLKQLSNQMISLGCVYAANLDGGGSTVVKAYVPKIDSFETVNKPSDQSERKVSNAVAFYNPEERNGEIAYSYLTPESFFVLSNGAVALGRAYFTDLSHRRVDTEAKEVNERENKKKEKQEAVTDDVILKELLDISSSYAEVDESEDEPSFNYLGFTYSAAEGQGIVENNEYKPMGYSGFSEIISKSPDGLTNIAYTFRALDKVDKIEIDGLKPVIYKGDVFDASAKAFYKGYLAVGGDSCFVWNSSNEASFTVDENGALAALGGDEEAVLSVSFGDCAAQYSFKIKELPFNDIENHWAKYNTIEMYEKGISIGELTEKGRLYFPERTFTRNEFCVMLSRLLGLTKAADTVEEEKSVDENAVGDIIEANNAVSVENEMGNIIGDGEQPTSDDKNGDDESHGTVLQEEIPVQEELTLEETAALNYADIDSIPAWAMESVQKLYEKGILDGFEHLDENGNVIFDGGAFVTRREVIRLIGAFLDEAGQPLEVRLSDISEDDADIESITKALQHGIFKGYLDGTLRPDNFLTRGEVSAVFVRLLELI